MNDAIEQTGISGKIVFIRGRNINIQIMRAFVRMRHTLALSEDLKRELDALKKTTDQRFNIIFTVLDQVLQQESRPRKQIGFMAGECAVTKRVNPAGNTLGLGMNVGGKKK
jgi:hypothetical protein